LFNGMSDTEFSPDTEITREQIVKVLLNFMKSFSLASNQIRDQDVPDVFNDSDRTSDWAAQEMDEAYRIGLIQGYADQSLAPKQAATLAECATLMQKLLKITALTN